MQSLTELSVKNLVKVRADFELSANFNVGVGERVALVGKSGSGKTTLLRILAGLEPLVGPSDGGQIWLGNEEITHWTPQKREVGFVFQDAVLFQALSVLDNVTFGLRMKGIPRSERDSMGLEWLDRVGLRSKAHGAVDTLSGGEKQRVAFVRALIWKPRFLLLDEPFSALDRGLRESLRAELLELHQLWPAPLLLVTHDENDIQALTTVRLKLVWEPPSQTRQISRELTNV